MDLDKLFDNHKRKARPEPIKTIGRMLVEVTDLKLHVEEDEEDEDDDGNPKKEHTVIIMVKMLEVPEGVHLPMKTKVGKEHIIRLRLEKKQPWKGGIRDELELCQDFLAILTGEENPSAVKAEHIRALCKSDSPLIGMKIEVHGGVSKKADKQDPKCWVNVKFYEAAQAEGVSEDDIPF